MNHKILITMFIAAFSLSLSSTSFALLIWMPDGTRTEAQIVDNKLMLQDVTGKLSPAHEGIYKTEKGSLIIMQGGIITTQGEVGKPSNTKTQGEAVGPMYNAPVASSAPAVATTPTTSAQTMQAPKSTTQAVPQTGDLLSPKGILFPPAVMNNRGDAATAWVSPVQRRHDSRISGEIYTIDSVQIRDSFGFTAINPDSQYAIEVSLSCFHQNGLQHPSYTAVLKVPRWGVATWDAGGVTPERSTDRLTADQDLVWCMLRSDKPFVAFGTRLEVSNLGTDRSDVTLVPIAR